jgi:hypothetical protein
MEMDNQIRNLSNSQAGKWAQFIRCLGDLEALLKSSELKWEAIYF